MPRGPEHARPIKDRILEWSIPEPNSGCWLWLGAIDFDGYAKMQVGSRTNGTRQHATAHSQSYRAFICDYDKSLYEIDHTCRVRSCVNPAHLEAVTDLENCRRRDIALGRIQA